MIGFCSARTFTPPAWVSSRQTTMHSRTQYCRYSSPRCPPRTGSSSASLSNALRPLFARFRASCAPRTAGVTLPSLPAAIAPPITAGSASLSVDTAGEQVGRLHQNGLNGNSQRGAVAAVVGWRDDAAAPSAAAAAGGADLVPVAGGVETAEACSG